MSTGTHLISLVAYCSSIVAIKACLFSFGSNFGVQELASVACCQRWDREAVQQRPKILLTIVCRILQQGYASWPAQSVPRSIAL
jgi:hypothetical protein